MKEKLFFISPIYIFFIVVMFGIIALVAHFFTYDKNEAPMVDTSALQEEFDDLVNTNSALKEFTDDVRKWEEITNENPDHIENYLTLGLVWKSLADRTHDDRHYARAIEVYKMGVEKSDGTNSVLLRNIGVLYRTYLKQYDQAELYYKKAIEANPGDQDFYVDLAELYEYQMKKTPDEVIAILNKGITTAVDSGRIQKYKKNFLERSTSSKVE